MIRLGFLGAGNMAFAIAGAVSDKLDEYVIVPYDISEERINLFKSNFKNVEPVNQASELEACDILILAVKPQMMKAATAPLSNFSGLVISIAAGIGIFFYEEIMPNARVIRVMPNTPCLVGEMAAGFAPGSRATEKDLKAAETILGAAGVALKVEESLIDAVTGVSGSGPAYFARLAEAFIKAGIDAGLSPDVSRQLSLQTMKGTAALLLEKNMSPEELVTMVSSPNGTTVAGREVLEASDYEKIVSETVEATIKRSKELGK
ncbi:MAG: pyrroline-5-carboxylate reductase [Spirochaetales bacterium]|nr:pyrroline-5-carboxylate reductase [Spirochaetales bacterium]